jgi:ABC-2 type transport system permease protein
MMSIFRKELSSFFSSLTGYIVLIVFLMLTGSFIWIFSSTSVFNYNYASLGQLFAIGPIAFMFLVPAITMQSFSEEYQKRTLEFLMTKPLRDRDIVLGKYLATVALIFLALIPTFVYFLSIYSLGSPPGNIDSGAVIGSYIGLFMLGAVYAAAGTWISSLSPNQIVSFIASAFACFVLFWAFDFISNLPSIYGKTDSIVKSLGLQYHYDNISKGRIDTRDIIYFISWIVLFLWLTMVSLQKQKL